MTLFHCTAVATIAACVAIPVHAAGTLEGSTLSFPAGHSYRVELAWPDVGLACNSSSGSASCDLEPGRYKWIDWTDGTEAFVTVVESAAGPVADLPDELPSTPEADPFLPAAPAFYTVGNRCSGPGTTDCTASCERGDIAISMTCNIIDGGGFNAEFQPFGQQLYFSSGSASCFVEGSARSQGLVSEQSVITADVVCAAQ